MRGEGYFSTKSFLLTKALDRGQGKERGGIFSKSLFLTKAPDRKEGGLGEGGPFFHEIISLNESPGRGLGEGEGGGLFPRNHFS